MTDGWLLDLFSMGVVTLDAEGRVRAANDRARRILRAGDALQLAGGRVVAPRREDATALARLLEGSCPNEVVGGLHARGSLQIERALHGARLTLLIADAHSWPAAPASEFVLFIHEPDAGVTVSEATLRALHGLTSTEARITALLVDRGAVASIAELIGVTTNTVRTHLKRVFGKIGVRSQSALIRAVLSGPAALQLNGESNGRRVGSAAKRLRDGTDGAP